MQEQSSRLCECGCGLVPVHRFVHGHNAHKQTRGDGLKQCSKCGRVLAVDQFSRDSQKKDGLRPSCRACVSAAKKADYQANWEERRAAAKAYYEKNRERILERERARWPEKKQNPKRREQARLAKARARAADPEKFREAERRWYAANPEKVQAKRLRLRDVAKAWREANRDALKAKGKEWRMANRERRKEIARRYYSENKDAIKSRVREWRVANPEKVRASHERRQSQYGSLYRERRRSWYRENRDRLLPKLREYARLHPDIRVNARHVRRAAIRSRPSEFVKMEALIRRDGDRCGICGLRMKVKQRSIDHILPISKGGSHTYANTRVTHLRCNILRGNRGAAQLRLLGD